jgi:hypothetical protein
MNNVKMINNWTVYKNSTIFYRKVKRMKLTFTQSENVRRTTDSIIKLEIVKEAKREVVATALTKLILRDDEVASNLREIAASIARTSSDKSRIKHAKRLLERANVKY